MSFFESNLKTLWSDVLSGTHVNGEKTIRQIQDKIYLNRKNSNGRYAICKMNTLKYILLSIHLRLVQVELNKK